MPIVQSTTYRFDSTAKIASCSICRQSAFYCAFANPTCDAVEKKIASLEGGVGAMLTSGSGGGIPAVHPQPVLGGDSFIAASTIYGGTINLFGVTLKSSASSASGRTQRQARRKCRSCSSPNTKAVFGETLANPALTVFDIEKWANIAQKNNVPLIVDNTFATPVLCRPIEWGADIVIHSTTKYMDGHAVQGGGVIVDGGGKFDWAASGKFPDFTEADESYHGVVYTREFGAMAYIIKARMQLMRDFGCYPAAHSAFLLQPRSGDPSGAYAPVLRERADRCQVPRGRATRSHPFAIPHCRATSTTSVRRSTCRWAPRALCPSTSRAARAPAMKFMDSLKLACNEVHVADIRTSCCIRRPKPTVS